MAAKRNPLAIRIEQLERELAESVRRYNYLDGKNDTAVEELQKTKSERDDRMIMVERTQRDVLSQAEWMRHLIEMLCIPAEKLAQIEQARSKITSDNESYGELRNRRMV